MGFIPTQRAEGAAPPLRWSHAAGKKMPDRLGSAGPERISFTKSSLGRLLEAFLSELGLTSVRNATGATYFGAPVSR